jgi:hypothetical protein
MGAAEADEMAEILSRVKNWSVPARVALARQILESVEREPVMEPRPRKLGISELIGLLKTDAPPTTDEECQAILEEELIKKHLK